MQRQRSLSRFVFLLLFAMQLEMCWLRAPGPRPRKSVSSASALSAERWAGTNSGSAFGSQTKGLAARCYLCFDYFAAIVPNGIKRDKTARHIAGLQGSQPIDLSEKAIQFGRGVESTSARVS
jgi:hypothetical protein